MVSAMGARSIKSLLGVIVLLVSCGPCFLWPCVKNFVVANFSHRCGAAQVVDRLTKLLALLLACWVAACFRLLFPLVLKGAGLFIGCLVEYSSFSLFSFSLMASCSTLATGLVPYGALR